MEMIYVPNLQFHDSVPFDHFQSISRRIRPKSRAISIGVSPSPMNGSEEGVGWTPLFGVATVIDT